VLGLQFILGRGHNGSGRVLIGSGPIGSGPIGSGHWVGSGRVTQRSSHVGGRGIIVNVIIDIELCVEL